MPRALSITYGSLTVGLNGDASIHLVDKYTFATSYAEARIDFDVVVSNATRATFLAAEAALVAEFRKPDQAVSIVLSATSRHSYNPADGTNTALRTSATCRKLGRDDDTANSARYACSIVCALPADLSGRAGRREATVSVQKGPAGLGVAVFSGVYTALTANSARTQYQGAVGTWIDSIVSGLGSGTWKLAGEQFEFDDLNKVLRFSRTYEEEILADLAGVDTSALINQRLSIRRTLLGGNFAPGFQTQPLVLASVDYSTSVLRSVTTDLVSVYATVVRPHVVAHVGEVIGGTVVIQREEPVFDRTGNRIAVSMTLQIDSGSEFIASRLEVSDDLDPGIIFLPVWSGDPYDRDEHHGPITQTRRYVRTTAGRPGSALSDTGINPPPGYREIGRALRRSPFRVGLPGSSIELEGSTLEVAFLKVTPKEGQQQSPGLRIAAFPTFGGGGGSNPFPVSL